MVSFQLHLPLECKKIKKNKRKEQRSKWHKFVK